MVKNGPRWLVFRGESYCYAFVVQCVPIFPISWTFKNAALHPLKRMGTWEIEAFSLTTTASATKRRESKRSFERLFNGLTLVVLASGDTNVARFKVPFRIRAGIWTEIKVFSQDVTFGKVIATAKRERKLFRKVTKVTKVRTRGICSSL